MRNCISILVEDRFGALSRIIELFSSRGYNLSSICSGVCEDPKLQRLTLVVNEDSEKVSRIVISLNNLIDVIEAYVVDPKISVSREMMLAKIIFGNDVENELLDFLNLRGGKIIHLGTGTITFELTGTASDLDKYSEYLRKFKILEMARTGEAAIHG